MKKACRQGFLPDYTPKRNACHLYLCDNENNYMNTEFRCQSCNKKLFEGNLALLVQKRHQEPGVQPYIEVLCHRCKTLNVFTYDASSYVAK